MAAVKQLIVHSPSRGHKREVRAVDSGFLAESRPVVEGYRPRFGTPDLVNIAFALRDEGYRIVGAGLADRNSRPVADETEEGDLEGTFVAALQGKDSGRVDELLESRLSGLQLATIEVVDRDRSHFVISRDGTIRVLNGLGEAHLLSSLSDYLTAHG